MIATIGPVTADPYLWPYDGRVPVSRTALLCIDWQTDFREANDRSYECLILSDCTGATDPDNHVGALHMVTMQGGVFGCVATSADVIAVTEA